MPPLLLDDDEAIAIAVGLRTAARASVTGHRGDVGPGAGQARAGAARPTCAAASQRSGRRRSRPPVARADRRPAAPDRDRRGLPRRRVPALRLPQPRGHRRAAARSSRTRSSTSAAAGTSSPGTARREDWRTFRVDRLAPTRRRPACGSRRATLPAKDAAAYVEQSIAGAPQPLRGAGDVHAAGGRDRGPRPVATGARSSRSTSTAASTGPATTTSNGSRCGSRCSASTSRCTSRRS